MFLLSLIVNDQAEENVGGVNSVGDIQPLGGSVVFRDVGMGECSRVVAGAVVGQLDDEQTTGIEGVGICERISVLHRKGAQDEICIRVRINPMSLLIKEVTLVCPLEVDFVDRDNDEICTSVHEADTVTINGDIGALNDLVGDVVSHQRGTPPVHLIQEDRPVVPLSNLQEVVENRGSIVIHFRLGLFPALFIHLVKSVALHDELVFLREKLGVVFYNIKQKIEYYNNRKIKND